MRAAGPVPMHNPKAVLREQERPAQSRLRPASRLMLGLQSRFRASAGAKLQKSDQRWFRIHASRGFQVLFWLQLTWVARAPQQSMSSGNFLSMTVAEDCRLANVNS